MQAIEIGTAQSKRQLGKEMERERQKERQCDREGEERECRACGAGERRRISQILCMLLLDA